MELSPLLDELPADRRLALAYAPGIARADSLAVFLLDQRLSRLVSQQREPLLTQMRLAWWRDRLGEEVSGFHHDEPVLALLAGWGEHRQKLIGLVDGWEALLTDPPISETAIATFAHGRAQAFAALAGQLGLVDYAEEARRAAGNWALVDLAIHIGDPAETALVQDMIARQNWKPAKLHGKLRPLAVLHGLALRKKGAEPLLAGWRDGLLAVRLGLFGI